MKHTWSCGCDLSQRWHLSIISRRSEAEEPSLTIRIIPVWKRRASWDTSIASELVSGGSAWAMSGVRSTLLVPLGRSMCNLRTSVSRNAILHRGQIFFERLSRHLWVQKWVSGFGIWSLYDTYCKRHARMRWHEETGHCWSSCLSKHRK